MPYSFEYDPGNRVLRGLLQDRVSEADLRELYARSFQQVVVLRPVAYITDTSGVTSFDVNPETIRYLATSRPQVPPGCARYIVAPADFMFGIARMFEILGGSSRPDLRVVRSLAAAYKDLGLAEPHFELVP